MNVKHSSEGSVSIHPAQLKNSAAQDIDHTSRLAPGLVIHVSDTLCNARRSDLERVLAHGFGINDARFNANHPHLLLVDYDSQQVNSQEVLNQVHSQKVRAQLIGPI